MHEVVLSDFIPVNNNINVKIQNNFCLRQRNIIIVMHLVTPRQKSDVSEYFIIFVIYTTL